MVKSCLPTDYNALALQISEILGVDCCCLLKVIKSYLEQFKISNESEKQQFFNRLEKEILTLESALKKLGKIKINLSDKEKLALQLSGYTPFGFNLSTIAGEI